jgi:drug/metabolite transporter (DMT)-like permease
MFTWRGAIILGVGFIVVGAGYLLLQGNGESSDRSGATMLILLGAAMAFVFSILLRGSREL